MANKEADAPPKDQLLNFWGLLLKLAEPESCNI